MRNYVAVVDVALLVHRPTQFGLSGIFGKLFVFENFKKKKTMKKPMLHSLRWTKQGLGSPYLLYSLSVYS